MGTLARENGGSRARKSASPPARQGRQQRRINPQLSVVAVRTWNVNWPMTPTFYDVLTEEAGRTPHVERVVETRSRLSRPSMKEKGPTGAAAAADD